MSIATAVNQAIDRVTPGQKFGYEEFPQYRETPGAVVRAVNRSVDNGRLKRVEKGRFYRPRTGVLGDMPVSDEARVRDMLYRNGQRCGYITGPALYSRLGLSTQVPKTIAVATNRAAQTKDFGTIRIKLVPRRAPITDLTVPLLEILDSVRDAKKVPDASTGRVLKTLEKRLLDLAPAERAALQRLAMDYYNAGTKALLGLLLTHNGQGVLPKLRPSINPTTRFNLGIDPVDWPEARACSASFCPNCSDDVRTITTRLSSRLIQVSTRFATNPSDSAARVDQLPEWLVSTDQRL